MQKDRCLVLVKGRHRFIFRYPPGRESVLLAAFVALAQSRDSVFDWFDAAALAFQLGHQPEPELERVV